MNAIYTDAERVLLFPRAGGIAVTAITRCESELEPEAWVFADGSVLAAADDADHFAAYPCVEFFEAARDGAWAAKHCNEIMQLGMQ